jgi:hypothetical protein
VRADPCGGGEKRGYKEESLHWRILLFELIQAYCVTGVELSFPMSDRPHHRCT